MTPTPSHTHLALATGAPTTEASTAVHAEIVGNMALGAAANAALVVDKFHPLKSLPGGVNIGALVDGIQRSAAAIRGGDLAEVEGLLLAQAQALNVIFTQYALRSADAGTQDKATALLVMALKAQASSRATLATLVDLKFPKTTVIAKQANLSSGHQQVNNATERASLPLQEQGGQVVEVPLALGTPELSTSRLRARKPTDRTGSRVRK